MSTHTANWSRLGPRNRDLAVSTTRGNRYGEIRRNVFGAAHFESFKVKTNEYPLEDIVMLCKADVLDGCPGAVFNFWDDLHALQLSSVDDRDTIDYEFRR